MAQCDVAVEIAAHYLENKRRKTAQETQQQ